MKFNEFITKAKKSPRLTEDEIPNNQMHGTTADGSSGNKDNKYFEILNPDTGLRFDIPLLSPLDPDYYYNYIYYMKLRERSPETFNKLIGWE